MANSRNIKAIDSAHLPERTLRVTIPVKVAYDLKSFQKVIANLAERFGCPACCSGHDVLFEIEREFIVDPKTLNIESTSAGKFI